MNYSTVDGKVINDAGDIAIAYYQTIPHTLKVNSRDYVFAVKRNICMAWIKAEDVDTVLGIYKTCCGNNRRIVYRLEHETHVRRFVENVER